MAETGSWTEDNYLGLLDVVTAFRAHPEEFQGDEGPRPPGFDGMAELEKALKAKDLDRFLDRLAEVVPYSFHQGLSLGEIMRQLARQGDTIFAVLSREYKGDAARLIRAARSFTQLKDEIAVRVGEVYAGLTAALIEEENRKIIRELSTPVIQVWEGILVVPLVGVLDSKRAHQMTEQLLGRISALGTLIVILDVTGVPAIDTEVANHLLSITRAARLLGTTSIMVGISPRVAQTLVRLNVNLASLETYGDLRSGLARALNLTGHTVQRASP